MIAAGKQGFRIWTCLKKFQAGGIYEGGAFLSRHLIRPKR